MPFPTKGTSLGFVAVTVLLTAAVAQTPSPAAPVSASVTTVVTTNQPPSLMQQIKHPFSWMGWGGDLRVRNEYFNDLLTLNPDAARHEQDYFRFRARVWSSITPVDDLSLNARLSSEPREWMKPAGFTSYKGHLGMDWTEGIVDSCNVKWINVLQQPATVTVGRQDIMLGDGWLVCEGTPNDGSWTLYLDSARLTYELKEQHTSFELIGIAQNAHDSAWMPTINNQNRIESEQNENGVIFCVANTSLPAANLTGYFIYKHDDLVTTLGDNADIYTVGGRLSGLLGENWKYSAEGAYQFGWKQDQNIDKHTTVPASSTANRPLDAFGVNSKLTWLAKDLLNNQLNFSFEFLSGDKPGTGNDEMFDVLWGRWPRWSEIGLYSFAPESRIGQEANLIRLGPGWSITPLKNLDFSTAYYALFAPESTPTRESNASLFSNSGNFRGHFIQSVLKYKFNAHVSGHLWGECLFPGNYYVYRDPMPFLRAEITLTF